MKINFSSEDFVFMPKPDEYYIEGHPTQCESDCSEWSGNKLIESGWGFFNGLTMVSYAIAFCSSGDTGIISL